MAIDIGTNDVWMVRLNYGDGKSEMYNVLHYRVTAVTDLGTSLPAAIRVPIAPFLTPFGSAISGLMNDAWKQAASTGVHYSGCSLQGVWPLPRSVLHHEPLLAPLNGLVDSHPLPQQDCPTILKKSMYGTRWGIGRMFVVGCCEEHNVDGLLTVEGITKWSDFAGVLTAPLTFSGGGYSYTVQPVIIGPTGDGALRITPITTHILSDNVIKTQRRRRPGKGI